MKIPDWLYNKLLLATAYIMQNNMEFPGNNWLRDLYNQTQGGASIQVPEEYKKFVKNTVYSGITDIPSFQPQGLFLELLQARTLNPQGADMSPLIETMVEMLQQPFLQNRITRDDIAKLRKAILTPEELGDMRAELRLVEFRCFQCKRPFQSREAMTWNHDAHSNVILYCTSCLPAQLKPCGHEGCVNKCATLVRSGTCAEHRTKKEEVPENAQEVPGGVHQLDPEGGIIGIMPNEVREMEPGLLGGVQIEQPVQNAPRRVMLNPQIFNLPGNGGAAPAPGEDVRNVRAMDDVAFRNLREVLERERQAFRRRFGIDGQGEPHIIREEGNNDVNG